MASIFKRPVTVTDPKTRKKVRFDLAPHELLAHEPSCWVLHPGEKWHGFEGVPDGYCMLDPIKPGIVCPGMGDDGKLETRGVPAAVVSAYLGERGIVPSRTTDFMILPLFSIGITKGKWATLINVLYGHAGEVNSAVFSPDGARIITTSDDRTVRLWDSAAGTEISVLRGHQSTTLSAIFSPDCNHVATSSRDRTVRLWEAASGTEITRIAFDAEVTTLARAKTPLRWPTRSAGFTCLRPHNFYAKALPNSKL